jgi:DNA-binding MarR family transcriptional regulator
MYLSGRKHREISRELGIDRETVTRILSQDEAQLWVRGYRSTVLKMVLEALITVYECVQRMDRQAATEVLREARILVELPKC